MASPGFRTALHSVEMAAMPVENSIDPAAPSSPATFASTTSTVGFV